MSRMVGFDGHASIRPRVLIASIFSRYSATTTRDVDAAYDVDTYCQTLTCSRLPLRSYHGPKDLCAQSLSPTILQESGMPAMNQLRASQAQAALATSQPASARPGDEPLTSLLHIYHNGLNPRYKRILTADKKTTLYTFEQNRRSGCNYTVKPHVKIYSGSSSTNETLIGVMNFDGPVIHLKMQDVPQILMAPGIFYKSPALEGRTIQWKKDGFFSRGDLVCKDDKGVVLANLTRTGLSVSKTGTFQLKPLVLEMGGKAVEEVVVGGIAMVELQKKQDRDSMGNAEGGGVS